MSYTESLSERLKENTYFLILSSLERKKVTSEPTFAESESFNYKLICDLGLCAHETCRDKFFTMENPLLNFNTVYLLLCDIRYASQFVIILNYCSLSDTQNGSLIPSVF